MRTDTISDILTRIRNASLVKHKIVYIVASRIALEILSILKEEGFIKNFKMYNKNEIAITLNYFGNKHVCSFSNLRRISKPGLRVYVNSKNLLRVLGVALISTSFGIMTNLKAKKLGIGGEVLFEIW